MKIMNKYYIKFNNILNNPTAVKLELFTTAFLQVMLVSMNIIFINGGAIIPMMLTGFGISLVWTFNVKKIAFGSNWDKIVYASGAMIGTLIGYLISSKIELLIKTI